MEIKHKTAGLIVLWFIGGTLLELWFLTTGYGLVAVLIIAFAGFIAFEVWRVSKPKEGLHPPRNLLTHYKETVAAMFELEDPRWLMMQRGNDENSLSYVMERLEAGREWREGLERGEEVTSDFVIYGTGGFNRYAVRPNGGVWFIWSAARTPQIAIRARELGFKII